MLERDAIGALPMRERLPTIPHDLSEYARTLAGPEEPQETPAPRSTSSASSAPSARFVDVWPGDIPQVTGRIVEHAAHIDHREASLLAYLDGESTVASILASVDLPYAEVMAIIEGLCTRGIVRIDHGQRKADLI